jgi:hypothetical protein
VRAPDGRRWKVRRLWTDRPATRLRRRLRRRNETAGETINVGSFPDPSIGLDLPGGVGLIIGAIAVVLVIVFVLLPLIGIALELIVLFLLVCSGVAGRLFLGRPWIVAATALGAEDQSVAYGVQGWRRSGEAIAELASAIEDSGPPERLAAGPRIGAPGA